MTRSEWVVSHPQLLRFMHENQNEASNLNFPGGLSGWGPFPSSLSGCSRLVASVTVDVPDLHLCVCCSHFKLKPRFLFTL